MYFRKDQVTHAEINLFPARFLKYLISGSLDALRKTITKNKTKQNLSSTFQYQAFIYVIKL